MNYRTQTSEIKLEDYTDGTYPGKDNALKYLLESVDEFIDVSPEDKGHWVNDINTLVFTVKENAPTLRFAKAIFQCRPDEFNYFRLSDGRMAVRLWWD